MKNVKITFQILPGGEKASNGIQFVDLHMAFDVTMKDFRRKGLSSGWRSHGSYVGS